MESYENKTKEELIQEIASLKRMQEELLQYQQQQDTLEFSWTGNLGQWYWDFPTNEVTYNPLKATALGYTKEELPEKVPYQFFTDKLHPDDKDEVMEKMRKHLDNKLPVWEVKYRIQAKDGSWRTYFDRGKVTQRTEDGDPLFLTGIVFDVTDDEIKKQELIKQNKKWIYQAQTDSLTGLFNRKKILIELAKMLTASNETKQPMTVLFLDIDAFKEKNDRYGHVFGDEVLGKVGEVIRSEIRKQDVAGRYGGDEFLVLFPRTEKAEAVQLAENIRSAIRHHLYSQPVDISVSGGVAESHWQMSVSQLVQAADEKLYEAKQKGKNQIYH